MLVKNVLSQRRDQDIKACEFFFFGLGNTTELKTTR